MFLASFITIIVGIVVSFVAGFIYKSKNHIGIPLDSYKGVVVYNNGEDSEKVFGVNKSSDGYVYGYKWQCVEFVNRFYHDVLGISISGGGNAKEYFDSNVKNGEINLERGLLQYINGEGDKPKLDDIIVYTNGKYGHVAIVCYVGEDYIEVIQQNIKDKTRVKLPLTRKDDKIVVDDGKGLAGWLRKE